ncbi:MULTISPECIES: nucleotidyltransferase family protein [Pseudomonas]|uniref:Nucleotidyltransferase family protein n=1 Tax=Pseudomonas chlororaphis TaxID=587753 RepID=A0A0D5Y130_9PSED|nr:MULTISPECIES: nucleotidyltransferase family protein [Pseudomonas]AJO78142.1 hypothetical protein TO66_12830 [Pseudomonas sp. MRSN 12121]AKA25021.1 hypothetical protein PCL1606_35700 [Pseudomonas chlororaphis]
MIVDERANNLLLLALSAGMASIDEEGTRDYVEHLLSRIDRLWLSDNQALVVPFMHKTKILSFVDSIFPFVESCRLFELTKLYHALVAVTAIRRSMLEPVFKALTSRHVDVMPYKGVDFIYNYPGRAAQRFISDVDLIVRRDQLPLALEVFESQGFFQAQVSKDKLSADGRSLYVQPWASESAIAWRDEQAIRPYIKVAKVEALQAHQEILSEYTVIYLSGQPMVIAYIDLEFSVVPGGDEQDVWSRTRAASVAGDAYPGLCRELYVCSLFQRASGVSDILQEAAIYPFVDALRVLAAGGIDWDYLWTLAHRYQLVAAVSRGLIEATGMLRYAIPAQVVDRCRKNLQGHEASPVPPLLEWLGTINAVR